MLRLHGFWEEKEGLWVLKNSDTGVSINLGIWLVATLLNNPSILYATSYMESVIESNLL